MGLLRTNGRPRSRRFIEFLRGQFPQAPNSSAKNPYHRPLAFFVAQLSWLCALLAAYLRRKTALVPLVVAPLLLPNPGNCEHGVIRFISTHARPESYFSRIRATRSEALRRTLQVP